MQKAHRKKGYEIDHESVFSTACFQVGRDRDRDRRKNVLRQAYNNGKKSLGLTTLTNLVIVLLTETHRQKKIAMLIS